MPILTDEQRTDVWREFMTQISRDNEPLNAPLKKPDLRAAVDAFDQWVSDNAASGNQALPLPARTALTAAQKARLNSLIVLKRFATGV